MIGCRVLPPVAGSPRRRRCSSTILERRLGSRRGRQGTGSTRTSTLPDAITAPDLALDVKAEPFEEALDRQIEARFQGAVPSPYPSAERLSRIRGPVEMGTRSKTAGRAQAAVSRARTASETSKLE